MWAAVDSNLVSRQWFVDSAASLLVAGLDKVDHSAMRATPHRGCASWRQSSAASPCDRSRKSLDNGLRSRTRASASWLCHLAHPSS